MKKNVAQRKANGPKPEVLYNGIELPCPWPPRHRNPDSAEPMPLPYFLRSHRPHKISIDVGRQLFVDDFLIENTTLKRIFHRPRKFHCNPVFQAETGRELALSGQGERGEEATTYLGHGGVFYDPAQKHFKMFYTAGWRGPLSLATSTDMKTWKRCGELLPEGLRWNGPELDTAGSDNCVWLDLNAKNPVERIKYLTCWKHAGAEGRPRSFSHTLHVSDGETWSDAVPANIIAGDYCSFFYNPFRRKWCFSIKNNTSRGRARYYYESDEFTEGADWAGAVYWTGADRLDAPEPEGRYPSAGKTPELYSLNAVAYESLMVGLHYVFRGPDNDICRQGEFPKLVDLELGFSRDGFHWDRPDRRGFIVGSRAEGAWDRAYLHGTAGVFVVFGDQLIFPYCGFSGAGPGGRRGMYTGGSIGIATLRRDGFASMQAGEREETLLTRPVTFSGRHLFVNVDNPGGALSVEVCSESGEPLPGFGKTDCRPVNADSTKTRVAWKGKNTIEELAGHPVRFRFYLSNGDLYSFWVSETENGESGGYVAAGGPGFECNQDV